MLLFIIAQQKMIYFITHRDSVVRIVKNDFNISGQHSLSCSLMQECLTLFGSQVGKFIAKHKLNGKEEITFARTISTDNYIMPFIKWFNNRLLAITFESLDNDLEKMRKLFLATIKKINQFYFGSKEAS